MSVREDVCDVLLCKAGLRGTCADGCGKRDYSYVGVYGLHLAPPHPTEPGSSDQGESRGPAGRGLTCRGCSVPWQ